MALARKIDRKLVLDFLAMFVLLSFLLACGTAAAFRRAEESLLFLVNANIMPIGYEENGAAKGVVVDIAQALGKKIGRPVEIAAMDWTEAQRKVQAGEADALLQINRTDAREGFLAFSVPLLPSEFVIIRRLEEIGIQREIDLEGKRVGVEAGGYAYDLIGQNERIERVLVQDTLQGLELVQAKELDAFVVDRWVGEYVLAQNRIAGLHIAREPLDTTFSHIAVGKGNDELLGQINSALQKMGSDGTLTKILNDWRGKNVIYITQESMVKIILLAVIAMLLIVLSGALFFVVKLKKLNRALEQKVAERTQELGQVNERLQIANAELKEQSVLDQLTQIPNRRGFDSLFREAWKTARKTQKPLALIILDIDNFKSINDSFGHLMGDQCLKELAQLLQNAARHLDAQAARLSGDEFACIFPGATEDQAIQAAESIRARLEKLVIDHEGIQAKISASFGAASLVPSEAMARKRLFRLADQALYKAKECGRNTVVGAEAVGRNRWN
ncbi:MAG: GGDEF domain-containing protein [Firmicutes bacterium]|nr:GGDEF domain-containing protein [Bacillota bacterium]